MSIDVREIRLGNWVKLNGQVIQWQQDDLVVLNDLMFSEKDIEPIVITEDILVSKCGFEREDMGEDGVHIYIPVAEGYCLNLNRGTIWLEEIDTKINTLHQLQNLYELLSGEPLNIQL